MTARWEVGPVIKAMQWERIKGELRALVAVNGSYYGEDKDQHNRWEKLGERVEEFIGDIEADGLNE